MINKSERVTNNKKKNRLIYVIVFCLFMGVFLFYERKSEVDILNLIDIESFYEKTNHNPVSPRKIMVRAALSSVRNVNQISYRFNQYFIKFLDGEEYEYKYLIRDENDERIRFVFTNKLKYNETYPVQDVFTKTDEQYILYFSK